MPRPSDCVLLLQQVLGGARLLLECPLVLDGAAFGLHPSSFHRRVRKLRRFLEPLRRAILPELAGNPQTLIVDSTLLSGLHPRQAGQSAGFEGAAWVRWGSFSVYGG
jgi:hypothetical protein